MAWPYRSLGFKWMVVLRGADLTKPGLRVSMMTLGSVASKAKDALDRVK